MFITEASSVTLSHQCTIICTVLLPDSTDSEVLLLVCLPKDKQNKAYGLQSFFVYTWLILPTQKRGMGSAQHFGLEKDATDEKR